jgi:hypothetical protein
MAKINYSKAEEAFDKAMRQRVVDQLLENALWTSLVEGTEYYRGNNPHTVKTDKMIAGFIIQIQTHLKLIKESDKSFYDQLNLTPSEEQRILGSTTEITQEDWRWLKQVKEMLAKYEPAKSPQEAPEDVEQIKFQQKEHVNKRYNVKKGWVPL